jgi:hypothetical protein
MMMLIAIAGWLLFGASVAAAWLQIKRIESNIDDLERQYKQEIDEAEQHYASLQIKFERYRRRYKIAKEVEREVKKIHGEE